MRRVIAFFEWQKDWWLQRANSTPWADQDGTLSVLPRDSDYTEGRVAYAIRQADICAMFSTRCREAWKGTDLYLTLGEQL